jgi:hypothetical protein
MASTEIRNRRRILRYRGLVLRQTVQMKNRVSGLLMSHHSPQKTGRAKNQRDSALADFCRRVHDSGYRVSLTLFRGVTNGSRSTEAQAGSLGHLHCGIIRPWLTW